MFCHPICTCLCRDKTIAPTTWHRMAEHKVGCSMDFRDNQYSKQPTQIFSYLNDGTENFLPHNHYFLDKVLVDGFIVNTSSPVYKCEYIVFKGECRFSYVTEGYSFVRLRHLAFFICLSDKGHMVKYSFIHPPDNSRFHQRLLRLLFRYFLWK